MDKGYEQCVLCNSYSVSQLAKVNKGNLGHCFDFLVLLRREDGYLKAHTIELTFTQCASSTAKQYQRFL